MILDLIVWIYETVRTRSQSQVRSNWVPLRGIGLRKHADVVEVPVIKLPFSTCDLWSYTFVAVARPGVTLSAF